MPCVKACRRFSCAGRSRGEETVLKFEGEVLTEPLSDPMHGVWSAEKIVELVEKKRSERLPGCRRRRY